MTVLTSPRVQVADEQAAMEYAVKEGWTDGLPVVAPTPERVEAMLTYGGLEPDFEVGYYEIRNRRVSAEKVAINAVMAGCDREYFPVVVAAVEAVMDHEFHMNHLASTSSPWPAFVVNGPVVQRLGLHSGGYVMGPGHRPNATIGRAISLTLANCVEARVGGVQQGVLGIPSRVGGSVFAENEDTSWEPLHVTRGFSRETSAITAVPHFHAGPQQFVAYPPEAFPSAESLASLITETAADHSSASLGRTTLVLISPPMQRRFAEAGWTKQTLRDYIMNNLRYPVAKFKRQSKVDNMVPRAFGGEPAPDGTFPLAPEDHQRFFYPARADKGDFEMVGGSFQIDDFLIAVAGADTGELFGAFWRCYPIAPSAVTKEIRVPQP